MKRPTWRNKLLFRYVQWWQNHFFLNRIRRYQDFIGVNYYFHNLIDNGLNKNENKICSDLGWELYPGGLYHVLKDLARYDKPIFVTENGLADSQDQHRAWYLKETVRAMGQALTAGVDLRGYFHWSLLDNFEWAEGFSPKFGLFAVDTRTFERRARPSRRAHRWRRVR